MLNETKYYCPEHDEGFEFPKPPSRRAFLRAVGGTAALAAVGSRAWGADDPAPAPKPAEGLIRELFATLSADQRRELVLPYDHGASGSSPPTRRQTFNSPVLGKRLGEVYTEAQRDLQRRILQAVLAGDEALERVSRHGRWDSSGAFDGCGAVLFGEPGDDSKYAWVFSGHHLTLRCDGNSHPGAAWGGPVYYGHSAGGYSERNVYHYQTQQVQAVFDALSGEQQEKALGKDTPSDGRRGLEYRSPRPGIAYADLAADQRALVEQVMRTLLGPFRSEDVDEVMQLVKANGGMEQIHLAFYADANDDSGRRWHFWRLEGPGFVWNYRVLPHVHCFVNIEAA